MCSSVGLNDRPKLILPFVQRYISNIIYKFGGVPFKFRREHPALLPKCDAI